jgi:P-type conjugative transfer protein TrbJ
MIGLAVDSLPVWAGGSFTGATEVTQLLNEGHLVEQYSMQGNQYAEQLLQTAKMIQNLENNPLGVQTPDLMLIANNLSRTLALGKDIGSSMARVDQNFATTFKSPVAQNYANQFRSWTDTSMDGLQAAMRNAGLQREQFPDDASALQGLVQRVSSANGNLSALQALGSINAQQVQESMKLRDLIATQQQATNQYLAAQRSSEQRRKEDGSRIMGSGDKVIPTQGSNIGGL